MGFATMTRAGVLPGASARSGAIRTTPACVAANAAAYFGAPRKLRSVAVPRSSGAIAANAHGTVADESPANKLRNASGGENEVALTAAAFLGRSGRHWVGGLLPGGRDVTPAGVLGAPGFGAGALPAAGIAG